MGLQGHHVGRSIGNVREKCKRSIRRSRTFLTRSSNYVPRNEKSDIIGLIPLTDRRGEPVRLRASRRRGRRARARRCRSEASPRSGRSSSRRGHGSRSGSRRRWGLAAVPAGGEGSRASGSRRRRRAAPAGPGAGTGSPGCRRERHGLEIGVTGAERDERLLAAEGDCDVVPAADPALLVAYVALEERLPDRCATTS